MWALMRAARTVATPDGAKINRYERKMKMRNFDNVLFLEARGCYFWEDDESVAGLDVGNYRVCTCDFLPAKNGRAYFMEFSRYDRRETRKTHKITGKPLKHPKTEITVKNALHLSTQFDDERGSWADVKIAREIHDKKRIYTKDSILTTVNEISIKQYDEIIIVNRAENIALIEKVYKMGGYRERAIIDELTEIKRKQCDREYYIISFIGKSGASFDYEVNTNRITG